MIKKIFLPVSILVLGLSFFAQVYIPTHASAADAANWQAGMIIDDAVFTNANAMSASQVQDFLNQKVGTGAYGRVAGQCDTNGVAISEYGGGTRADYGSAHGNPAPFTCLKDYYEVPKTAPGPGLPASNYGGVAIPAGAKSAAQIIWDAAQLYQISPKVLLVTIQKESPGPLTTDDWPFRSQYTYAMGAHCPDTSSCDANYAGFSIQIYESARLFRYYLDNMDQSWWPYKKLGSNSVLFNPNTGCGSSVVNITSRATAALYTYTPYQPNTAALNNLYGTGDSCSTYGNRNFWRIFIDWFGSTQTNIPYAWQLSSQTTFLDSAFTKQFNVATTVQPGGKLYARIKAQNMGYESWNQGAVNLGTSRPQDRTSIFYDSSWLSQQRPAQLMETKVDPGQVGTYQFTLDAPTQTGTYQECFNLVAEGQTWLNDMGACLNINVVAPVAPVASINNQLSPGEQLTAGSYVMSQDTQSVLRLQNDGNITLYSNFDHLIWSSNTKGSNTRLVMQSDGNLVLYNSTGSPLWDSGTSSNPGARLVLQTDGNLVVYDSSGVPKWNANYTQVPDHLYYVNTELYPAMLLPGQSLETTNRKYKFVLQYDSNLVLYSNNTPVWASGTLNRGAAYLSMQPDGNLVLYDGSGYVVWHTNTSGAGQSKLVLQPDGNLVLYNKVGATWSTKTNGK